MTEGIGPALKVAALRRLTLAMVVGASLAAGAVSSVHAEAALSARSSVPAPGAVVRSVVSPGTVISTCATKEEATRVFSMNNADFLQERSSANRCEALNWRAEGTGGSMCSVPSVAVQSIRLVETWLVPFSRACTQHDFGYYNFGNGGPLSLNLDSSSNRRKNVDEYWYAIMKNSVCNQQRVAIKKVSCLAAALLYYRGVRAGGGQYF